MRLLQFLAVVFASSPRCSTTADATENASWISQSSQTEQQTAIVPYSGLGAVPCPELSSSSVYEHPLSNTISITSSIFTLSGTSSSNAASCSAVIPVAISTIVLVTTASIGNRTVIATTVASSSTEIATVTAPNSTSFLMTLYSSGSVAATSTISGLVEPDPISMESHSVSSVSGYQPVDFISGDHSSISMSPIGTDSVALLTTNDWAVYVTNKSTTDVEFSSLSQPIFNHSNSEMMSLSQSKSLSLSTMSSPLSPLTLSTSPPPPQPTSRWNGFNIVNQSPTDPSRMKNTTEWELAFQNVRRFSHSLNAIRLYSTTDPPNYRHLLTALPVARKYNFGVHAGIWSGGDDHQDRFAVEKQALEQVLMELGCTNIIAVSVGNEDLYSNHTMTDARVPLSNITLLVNQVREVRDLLNQYNCSDTVKVTHTDTYGDWLQTNVSEALIGEVDFLTVNLFPYWESLHIDISTASFWDQLQETQQVATRYGKEVWIGETGWPVSGPQQGKAVASIDNLHTYWKEVGCGLMERMNAFWYVEWDADSPVSFGMLDASGQSIVGNDTCRPA